MSWPRGSHYTFALRHCLTLLLSQDAEARSFVLLSQSAITVKIALHFGLAAQTRDAVVAPVFSAQLRHLLIPVCCH